LSKLRVGVVGLGEVAQVIHLPIIEQLSDHYELAAICDISPGLLKRLGDRYRVEHRYTDFHEMIAAGGLDCVFILNSDEYHAEGTIAALDAGLDVLVEKPMCLSPREAEEIIAARDRSGKTVMVAYMRRYAPAFTEAVERLPELGPIRYARVHDVIGENRLIVDQTSYVDRPDDIPQEAIDEKWSRRSALVKDALGDVPEELGRLYSDVVLGSIVHDLAVIRYLLGGPLELEYADAWETSVALAGTLDGGTRVSIRWHYLEGYPAYREEVRVHDEQGSVSVTFPAPYLLHAPTVLRVVEDGGSGSEEISETRSTVEAFERQWLAFAAFAREDAAPRAGIAEGRQDIVACQRAAALLATRHGVAVGGEAA